MRRGLLAAGTILLTGCASYQQLQPTPPITPAEDGYHGVYDGDKMFILHKGKKYFIEFPSPTSDKYYLVLSPPSKSDVPSSLVTSFDRRTGSFEEIPDEAAENDSMSVYPIDLWTSEYAWLTGEVETELPLILQYRYVPRWRFTFENRHAAYRDSLAMSKADRTVYEAIRPGFNPDTIDARRLQTALASRHVRALRLQQELVDLEKLLPDDIAGSKDTAYLNYVALSEDVKEEIDFHDRYDTVLELLQKERMTRDRPEAFLDHAPSFAALIRNRERFPEHIRESFKELAIPRIAATAMHFEQKVKTKDDLELLPSLQPLLDLQTACSLRETSSLVTLASFIDRFNGEASALERFEQAAGAIESDFETSESSESLLTQLVRRAEEAGNLLPDTKAARQKGYADIPCARLLDAALKNARARAGAMHTLYLHGEQLRSAVRQTQWRNAESILASLHEQRKRWSDYARLEVHKDSIVNRGERAVFHGVADASRRRAESFITRHVSATANIGTLYEDSAFTPVHTIRFSRLGEDEVVRKRGVINGQMKRLKNRQFPETAVKALYRELQKDQARGAEFALAIVEHGKRYEGDDSQVKGLVNEFDASVAKTLGKAKEYRRVYALPVRRSSGGHEYSVKLQLRIPSDAQFPVFDLHIKLPEEVASRAGTQRWYKSITINGKAVKNEGRYRITSPLRENNFESLISPVQTNKNGRNILEIRFVHPDSRLFEISAMAQAPIIRKH